MAIFVNVKDAPYNAAGNGTTDDKTAIQNAIDAVNTAGGGVVFFPTGTYLLGVPGSANTAVLTLKSKVTLLGDGRDAATLKLAASCPNGCPIIGSASGLTRAQIRDLTIDGNNANQSNGQFGITLTGATFCAIERVHVTKTTSHGVTLQVGSNDNLVRFVEVDNYGQSGGGFGIVVFNDSHRNRIVESNVTSSNPNYCIAIDASSTGGGGTRPKDNVIIGCTASGGAHGIIAEDSDGTRIIANTASGQSAVGIGCAEGQDAFIPVGTIIEGNVVRSISNSNAVGIYVQGHGTQVRNNTLVDLTVAFAIKAAQLSSGQRPARDNVIAGNLIDTVTGAGIQVEEGILYSISNNVIRNITTGPAIEIVAIQNVNKVDIAGNIVDGVTGAITTARGIYIQDSGGVITDVRILDNFIRNVGMGAGNTADAIVISQSSSAMARVTVNRNKVIDDQGTATTRHAVSLGGSPTAVYITETETTLITGSVVSPASFASSGRAVLVAGTVTVTSSVVAAGENIVLSRVVAGGTLGFLSVGTITGGTSFVINSSSATDTSTVFWQIVR